MSRVSKFDHSQINLCDNRLIMDGSQKLKIKEIEPKARFHDELGVLKGKSLQSQILLIQGCENKPVSLKHVYHMTELDEQSKCCRTLCNFIVAYSGTHCTDSVQRMWQIIMHLHYISTHLLTLAYVKLLCTAHQCHISLSSSRNRFVNMVYISCFSFFSMCRILYKRIAPCRNAV